MAAEESPLAADLSRGAFADPAFASYAPLLPILAALDAHQRGLGIRGAVAEIGVYQGAFFLPLARCRREGETALAMDVFDRRDLNWNAAGGVASLPGFRAAVARHLGSEERVAYLEGDSLDLTPEAVLRATGGQRARLFSVDGSHSVHHTVNGIRLAGAVAVPGAVVFLDDVRNWGWPGVIEGFARYMLLSDHGRLVPFWPLGNKLLLTTPSHHAAHLAWAVDQARALGRARENLDYRVSRFFGHDTLGY